VGKRLQAGLRPVQPILQMDTLKSQIMEAPPGAVKGVISSVQFVPRCGRRLQRSRRSGNTMSLAMRRFQQGVADRYCRNAAGPRHSHPSYRWCARAPQPRGLLVDAAWNQEGMLSCSAAFPSHFQFSRFQLHVAAGKWSASQQQCATVDSSGPPVLLATCQESLMPRVAVLVCVSNGGAAIQPPCLRFCRPPRPNSPERR
jgi:hypothetical protein